MEWIWYSFWMSFYVFSAPFLNTCFGSFVFWFSIDVGKTDNFLNLIFRRQLETIMIPGSILASFRQHFYWFSDVSSLPDLSWNWNDFWHCFWLHCGTLLVYIVILFTSRFQKKFTPVPQRLFLDVPSSFWHPLGSVWSPFDTPWPSFLETVWIKYLHFRSLFRCRLLHLFPSVFYLLIKACQKGSKFGSKWIQYMSKTKPKWFQNGPTNWARK